MFAKHYTPEQLAALEKRGEDRDPGIPRSLGKVWQEEGAKLRQEHGRSVPTAPMMAYRAQALAAS